MSLNHCVNTVVSLRLSRALRCRLRFGFLFRSSLQVVFFNGERGKDLINLWRLPSWTPKEDTSRGKWTKVIVSTNLLVYMAQYLSGGNRLLLSGAKNNSLINKGQLWRLATVAVLHSNPRHLLVNSGLSYAVGPTVEKLNGPERFLPVYISSAPAVNN